MPKRPSARILILVHLCILGFFHSCNSTPVKDDPQTNLWKTRDGISNLGQTQESRFVNSDEEPGILLPADDKNNFVGQDDPTVSESIWRTGKNSQASAYPPTTIVSTNSYSIRPSSTGANSGSSPSYVVNARPVPMVTTGSSYTIKSTGDKYQSYLPKDGNKSTVFVKNNCFGHRCPPELQGGRPDSLPTGDDEWKSYHYILNQGVKHNNPNKYQRKLSGDRPSRRHNDVDRDMDTGIMHETRLSIPFRVDPTISKYETSYPSKFNKRVLQTTSSSLSSSTTPGWVKLQPIIPDRDGYDPFTLKDNKNHRNKIRKKPQSLPNDNNPNSQFADRLGVVLDPDSFAERWGWGDRDNSHRHHHHHGDKGGSRFPGWLQGQGDGVKSGSDRDSESRNWVKLEPIPVAGVTISKWVPKGTQNHELPSTNWPSRDPVHSSNGLGHSTPNSDPPPILPSNTKWWDIIDSINRLNQNRPQYGPLPVSPSYDDPPRGWSPNKGSSHPTGSFSSWDRDDIKNSWDDIIYPNGPNSATVSWQKDKQDMSKYGSSFSSTSSSPWQSDIRRPSASATGSWSAERDRDSYSGGYGGGNRRQGSSSYPDKHTSEDDPRWVLVSNSKKVTVSSANPNRRPSSYPPLDYGNNQKYRPDFDKLSDFPFYEQPRPPYKNRRGKDYKDVVQVMNITVTKPGSQSNDQDAAFKKINQTLSGLTPVLNKKRRIQGGVFNEDIANSSSSTSSQHLYVPGFLKPYFGSGRASPNTESTKPLPTPATTAGNKKGRRALKINPVYAAVGAGMIPATAAVVVPIMLGRKRRDIHSLETTSSEDDKLASFYHVLENPRFMVVAQPRRKRTLTGQLLHKKPLSTLNFSSSYQYLIPGL